MLNEKHDLIHELPEHKETIHELKMKNNHFSWIQFMLIKDGKIVLNKRYHANTPLASKSTSALLAAWNKSFGSTLNTFEHDLLHLFLPKAKKSELVGKPTQKTIKAAAVPAKKVVEKTPKKSAFLTLDDHSAPKAAVKPAAPKKVAPKAAAPKHNSSDQGFLTLDDESK